MISGFYPGNYHGKQVEWPESGLPPSPFEDNGDSAPRNYDSDGDGALDALELLSMRADQAKQVGMTFAKSKMEQLLTDVKSGNVTNLAAEMAGINSRLSFEKKGLEAATKAKETLRNEGLSGLYMHGGAALGNMIGVSQFNNAWEGRLEDGTRLHPSARFLDGALGIMDVALTVYPGTSAIKNGITAAMAAKTVLNGMGKTTWKNFVSATATAYCKITAGECFTGDTIVITGARSQTLIATADASGIEGWEWIVSATGLVLVSRLARRRSKKDDELTHIEPTRLEWSPLDPDDSSDGFFSGLSFPRKRESSMQGDVEVENLTHSQQKSTSKASNAIARPTGSSDGLPQWEPLVCAANTTISVKGSPPDPSKIPATSAQTDAESIDDIEIEPGYPCHEELAAALEAALQADMVGAAPSLRKAHFPVKPIASHSKVVESPVRAKCPDATAVRTRQRSSIAWSVVSTVSLMLAACCFTNGLPFLSSLWQGQAQAETALAKPTEELIGVKIRDLRPGQRVLARVRGTDSILQDTEINPTDWRLITLLMPKPGGDRIDIQLLRSLDWIEGTGAADGETIELNLEELGAAGPALVVAIHPCPPIEPDDGQGRRVITGTFRHSSANILGLRIAGEPEPILTTGYHPFWSEDRQEFVPAKTLETGERLLTASGTATTVLAINRQSGTEPVYNLEIDVDHVYHVGTSGVLVHNSCPKALAIIKRQHGLTPHDDAINAVFRSLRDERKGNWRFRKIQALIDGNNNLISYLRPDLQWTDRVGNRHVLQVVGSNPVTHAQIFRDLGIYLSRNHTSEALTMSPFEEYPVLTLLSVNKPLTEVTEAVLYDTCVRTCDASGIPKYIIDALGPELLGIGKAALYDLRSKRVDFDLGWGYRRRPTPGLTMPALYWTPLNCPDYTAIVVNSEEGNPNLLTSSTPYRDWDVLWTYVDDSDPDDSVCWIQFTGSKETVNREVWCGYSADDEKHPRWRFDEYGPLQPFEDATSY